MKILGLILAAVILLAAGFTGGYQYVMHNFAVYDANHTVQEDDPGWDCHTMGDFRC